MARKPTTPAPAPAPTPTPDPLTAPVPDTTAPAAVPPTEDTIAAPVFEVPPDALPMDGLHPEVPDPALDATAPEPQATSPTAAPAPDPEPEPAPALASVPHTDPRVEMLQLLQAREQLEELNETINQARREAANAAVVARQKIADMTARLRVLERQIQATAPRLLELQKKYGSD